MSIIVLIVVAAVLVWLSLKKKPTQPPTEPPHPPTDPPTDPPKPPDPPKKVPLFGWFLTDGRYSDFSDEVDDVSNAYHAWWGRGFQNDSEQPYDGPDGWKYQARGLVRRAHENGKRIVLCLEVDNPAYPDFTQAIDLFAPFWSSVELIDLRDEPDWTAAQAEVIGARVRNYIKTVGLAPKPVGITLEVLRQPFETDITKARGIDFWCIECYRSVAEQDHSPEVLARDMRAHVLRTVEKLSPESKVLLIGQGYGRNINEQTGLNNWRNEATLASLPKPTFDLLVELGGRGLGILWFSYGRPSGSREHQALLNEEKKIARKLGIK